MHRLQIPDEFKLELPIFLHEFKEEGDEVTITYAVRGFELLGLSDPTLSMKMDKAAFQRTTPAKIVMHIRQRLLVAVGKGFESIGALHQLETREEDKGHVI